MRLYPQRRRTFIEEFDAVLVLEQFSKISAEQPPSQLLKMVQYWLAVWLSCTYLAHYELESV